VVNERSWTVVNREAARISEDGIKWESGACAYKWMRSRNGGQIFVRGRSLIPGNARIVCRRIRMAIQRGG